MSDRGRERDLTLGLVIATVGQPDAAWCIDSWGADTDVFLVTGLPLLEAYQAGLERTDWDIVGFVHDDVQVLERGWRERVLREFAAPDVGLVGFGGAPGWGARDMYERPFEVVSLARRGFRSNMRYAEQHGERWVGECDVAVLDGMALFVRRSVLRAWPLGTPIGYHGYDYWLCAEVLRQGLRIRMVGVACEHLNGRSTGLGPEPITGADFEAAHRYVWDTCRDVLPADVSEGGRRR